MSSVNPNSDFIAESAGIDDRIPMSIVERDDIPSITSVIVDGQVHPLGIVKDFRKHDDIARFLPEIPQRISFSWVRLLPCEVLAVHSHPTATFILVCDGEGYFTGDLTGRMRAGSAVMVPSNCYHGFCGAGKKGFWAVSIQFEDLGLYEDTSNARVSFKNEEIFRPNPMNLLLDAQNFFMDDFAKNNYFFEFLKSDDINQNSVMSKFLDNVQHFSNHFQKILKARVECSISDVEKKLAIEHLEEEKDHDVNLARFRGNPNLTKADIEIEDLLNWFEASMRTDSDAEKIVLMHLVLEGSGELAHSAVYEVTKDMPVGKHFLLHQEEDDGHLQMGIDALSEMSDLNIEALLTKLITGWAKLNRLCELVASTALSK